MTQPQDKMRAEFEEFLRTSPAVPDWARNDVFDVDGYRDMYVQMMWDAWQAACAQQSAQSQQDALDAARFRWLKECATEVFGIYKAEDGEIFAFAWDAEVDDEFSSSVDAAIAAQGASNV